MITASGSTRSATTPPGRASTPASGRRRGRRRPTARKAPPRTVTTSACASPRRTGGSISSRRNRSTATATAASGATTTMPVSNGIGTIGRPASRPGRSPRSSRSASPPARARRTNRVARRSVAFLAAEVGRQQHDDSAGDGAQRGRGGDRQQPLQPRDRVVAAGDDQHPDPIAGQGCRQQRPSPSRAGRWCGESDGDGHAGGDAHRGDQLADQVRPDAAAAREVHRAQPQRRRRQHGRHERSGDQPGPRGRGRRRPRRPARRPRARARRARARPVGGERGADRIAGERTPTSRSRATDEVEPPRRTS